VLLVAFAFGVMADPVSSVTYAIEAALRAPLHGDMDLLLPTMGLVIGLVGLIIVNYHQLVAHYPEGGGAAAAASEAFAESGVHTHRRAHRRLRADHRDQLRRRRICDHRLPAGSGPVADLARLGPDCGGGRPGPPGRHGPDHRCRGALPAIARSTTLDVAGSAASPCG
jgi:hypothetical protein